MLKFLNAGTATATATPTFVFPVLIYKVICKRYNSKGFNN